MGYSMEPISAKPQPHTDKLTLLGTGHAMTTECFNTCFVYENERGKMLVDTGGGQQLVGRLRSAGIRAEDISCVFLSHAHTDHILGLPWLMRLRMRSLREKPLKIFAHRELCGTAKELLKLLLPEAEAHIGRDLMLLPVGHREEREILGRRFLFFDTGCGRCTQFGFAMELSGGERFVFNGDVPYFEGNREIAENAAWLMHEAFCLEKELHGGPGDHSSAAQAAKNAALLNAERLILVHCGDRELESRRDRYTREAGEYFRGEILVPDDLDTICLS